MHVYVLLGGGVGGGGESGGGGGGGSEGRERDKAVVIRFFLNLGVHGMHTFLKWVPGVLPRNFLNI